MSLSIGESSIISTKIQEILKSKDNEKSICIPADATLILIDKFTFSDLSKLNKKGINVLFQHPNDLEKQFGSYFELGETVNNENLKKKLNIELFTEHFIKQLEEKSFDDLIELVINNNVSEITQANIPQFSNFDDGTIRLISILRKAGNYGPIFDDLGLYLTESGKKAAAYKKYGENHSKLASLFDLVYIMRMDGANKVYLTELGKAIEKMPIEKSRNLLAKLAVKIPIIRSLIMDAISGEGNIKKTLSFYLSESTIQRRKPNVRYVINFIKQEYKGTKYREVLDNIK